MTKINRVELGKCVVRFFFDQEEAQREASLLTRGLGESHTLYPTVQGWLIRNNVTLTLRDYNGVLPNEAAETLLDCPEKF